MARRRLSVETRRAELIEVGKRIFSERPFDAISTEELARAAGISKGLLYHYFSNKRGFYVAVVRHLADELIAATNIDEDAPIGEALPGAIDGFYAFLGAHGPMYRTLIRGGIGSDSETAEEVDRVRHSMIERLTANLDLDSPTPEQDAKLHGWVGCAEAVGLHQVRHGALSEVQFRDLLITALLKLLD
ncbi:MAG: TetR/AcrR family transcriptional regulator [Myxococcales bacterium]|nr:TetR/AcrR family transcriptional regulator [Myxococcales bacterium]